MKVTVIDYGLSNLLSVRHAFAHFGAETLLTSDPADVLAAEKLVLPGVGAFKDGMDGLARLGLIEPIRQKAAAGTPLLGICLGMQMLFDESEEFGLHKGLGLIPGRVVKIPDTDVDGHPQKVPHISWDPLYPGGGRTDFSGTALAALKPGGECYFIHSYEAKPGTEESILAKISDICISMKAEDYLELPDLTYHEVPVELDKKSWRAYQDLERKMILELPEDDELISVTSAAALSNKLLQLANGAVYDEDRQVHEVHDCKIEAFLELVESLQGKPVLVFYNYQHDRERILKALEKSGLRIRELKTTQDEDDWNAGRIDILLTHPASSAYGLNLQQGGNHVIWFGLTWNYELYTQANKRLHRQGQVNKVIIHHLVSTGTRDEDVMAALRRKDDVQNWVMESLKARIRRIREGH